MSLSLGLLLLSIAGSNRDAPFRPAVGRPPASAAAQPSQGFREDFGVGWKDRWMETALSRRRTRYKAVREAGETVLKATSNQSASALWHKLALRTGVKGQVAWRWRVAASLSQNEHERERQGDDYAARLFVVFDSERFGPHAHALCYVWAAREAAGAVYRSPYANGVATIVLESGDLRANEWVAEERDFVADYRNVFGMTPKTVTAVAIMVDTDNTGLSATTWFASIELTSSGVPTGRQTGP